MDCVPAKLYLWWTISLKGFISGGLSLVDLSLDNCALEDFLRLTMNL